MGLLRPKWGGLLFRGARAPQIADTSTPVVSEDRGTKERAEAVYTSLIMPALGRAVGLPDRQVVFGSFSVAGYAEPEDYEVHYSSATLTNRRIAAGTRVAVRFFREPRPVHAPLPVLRFDPAEPPDGAAWVRADKTPPELRVRAGARTLAAALTEVQREVLRPRRPSASLYPRFYPRGFEPGTPRPRYPKATLHPPFYPRGE